METESPHTKATGSCTVCSPGR